MSSTAGSTVIGRNVVSTGAGSLSIAGGTGSITNPQANSVALGNSIVLLAGTDGVCIGNGAGLHGSNQCVAIGGGAQAGGTSLPFGVAVGRNCTALSNSGVAIGQSVNANAIGSVGIGSAVVATGDYAVAVGPQCGASTGVEQVVLGRHASGTGNYDIVIGSSAQCNSDFGVAIGNGANVSVSQGIAIGGVNQSTANSVIMGYGGVVNWRPNSVNSGTDLGTSVNNFKACYLKYSGIASSTLYMQLSSVNVNNTVVETSVTSGSSSLGTLVLPANQQSVGTALRFRVMYNATVTGVGDTLTLNFKVNGSTVLGATAVAATGVGCLEGHFVINASNNLCGYTANLVSGVANAVTSATTIAYNTGIINTFDVTALWSAANAGNLLSVDMVQLEVLYAT